MNDIHDIQPDYIFDSQRLALFILIILALLVLAIIFYLTRQKKIRATLISQEKHHLDVMNRTTDYLRYYESYLAWAKIRLGTIINLATEESTSLTIHELQMLWDIKAKSKDDSTKRIFEFLNQLENDFYAGRLKNRFSEKFPSNADKTVLDRVVRLQKDKIKNAKHKNQEVS